MSITLQVWSEPSMVEAGAYEFADTAKFLAAGTQCMHTCKHSHAPTCPVITPLCIIQWAGCMSLEAVGSDAF